MADVNALIAGAESRAQQLSTTAQSAISNALTAAGSWVVPGGAPKIIAPSAPTLPTLPAAPNIPAVTVPSLPSAPSRPSLASIDPDISATAPPAPSISADISVPSMPGRVAAFNRTAPQVSVGTTIPSAPGAFTGTAPIIGTVSMPSVPNISHPTFHGVRPGAPSTTTDYDGRYTAAQRGASQLFISALEGKVRDYILAHDPSFYTRQDAMNRKLAEYMSGTTETGFSPAVENAIYERSLSKTRAETQRVQDEAFRSAAKRGFTLPSGVLTSALQQARQAGADANAAAAREIVVMQAEMNQKNMQFAISTSADLHKAVMNASISYHQNLATLNGQAVQFAQGLLESLVKAAELAVQVYNASLEGYKADADVFQALIRASMSEVEVYKALIEGEKAKVDVDVAQISAFKAQVDAHGAAVDAYGKNVQALVAQAQLEKIKIDAFQAEVQAYQATVQGNVAEWQAYSAAWGGEESKVKAYLAQAQVYSAQVDGYRALVAAQAAAIQAKATSNQSELAAYTADVQAFGVQAQANAQIVSSTINAQNSLVNAYQVSSQAAIAAASASAESYRAQSTVAIANAQIQSTAIIEEARVLTQNIQGTANITLAAGQAYAGMASAALNGMTTLVSAEAS